MKTIDCYNEQAQELLEQFDQVNLVRQWITTNKRLDRTEQWLNLIIQKNNYKRAISQFYAMNNL